MLVIPKSEVITFSTGLVGSTEQGRSADLETSEKRERRIMTGTSAERFPSLLSHPLSLIFNLNIPQNAIAGEVRMAGFRSRSILPAQVAN